MRTKINPFLLGGMFLAGVGLLLPGVSCAKTSAPAKQPVKAAAIEYFYAPGYWSLAGKDVREEIGLTTDQVKKLKEISQQYYEALKKPKPQPNWAKMSAEERKKKYQEMAAESKKQLEEGRKKVEAVLTPAQLKKLEIIELRTYAPSLLFYGKAQDPLGLSEKQKQQLKKNQEDTQKKISDLYREISKIQQQANKAALELLTPDQIGKLKKMRREGTFWFGPKAKPLSVKSAKK
jgi:hypothetical protein